MVNLVGKPEVKFPGIQVRWAEDSGETGEKDSYYMLRWETLGSNRDRPREGLLPPPSMLRVIKVQAAAAD